MENNEPCPEHGIINCDLHGPITDEEDEEIDIEFSFPTDEEFEHIKWLRRQKRIMEIANKFDRDFK